MTIFPTPDGAFEFSDGFRRFAVASSGPGALDPGAASRLLERRLFQDSAFRKRLADWYRRDRFIRDDDVGVTSALLREIASGWIRLHDRGRTRTPYVHTYTRSEPRAPFEPQPSPLNEFDPRQDEPTVTEVRAVEYLAVGDFNFSTDRAIMLPGPSSEVESEGDHADGVALIAGLFSHLQRLDEDRRVMVAGHTDAAGSFAHNIELSERRAESVKLACEGDAAGFADHAALHGEVADAQEVLRWIARRFGWSCEPGPVDNDDGPKTSAARSGFRSHFEAEFGEPTGSGPAFERADWLAFFRLYEQDLAARLGVTPSGLPMLRARLAWNKPPVLGCGEHWPEGSVKRSPVNHDDRRVEILCFAPNHVPSGAGSPPGASVYSDPSYQWIAIRPGPGPHPLGGPRFELGLESDDFDSALEGATLRLHGGPYELDHALADAHKRGRFLVFDFQGVTKGNHYAATIVRDGGDPIALFDGASLDSYIAGIDDLELQPEPIPIHLARQPEPRESAGPYEHRDPPDDWDGIYLED